jgi:hypothetical protein
MAIKWDDIQTQAKDNGELVYAMDQGETVILKDISKTDHRAPDHVEELAPGPWGAAVPRGFCVGLTLRWLGLRYNGQDYPFNAKKQECEGLFWEATRDQNIARNTTGAWPLRPETVLRQYGATVNKGLSVQKKIGVSADLMMDTIAAGEGLYYFELRGNPPDAHSLGVQRNGDDYRLFDSNEGHFLVKKESRFRFVLTRFLNADNSRYRTEYPNETWTAVVNARR